jgi:hypothetical protein
MSTTTQYWRLRMPLFSSSKWHIPTLRVVLIWLNFAKFFSIKKEVIQTVLYVVYFMQFNIFPKNQGTMCAEIYENQHKESAESIFLTCYLEGLACNCPERRFPVHGGWPNFVAVLCMNTWSLLASVSNVSPARQRDKRLKEMEGR